MRNNFLSQLLFSLILFFLAKTATTQTPIEGYVFEENNRGYLRQVKVMILEMPDNIVRADTFTDAEGHFAAALPPGDYRLVAKKDIFFDQEQTFKVAQEKVFLKIEMKRRPGYLFDVTIAEASENPELIVDAVQGAWIEIYNRTQKRSELVLQNHPNAFFQHTFEQGNHYTILIRKPGFLAKRIEVYVNVEGCILCVDGVSSLAPGVTDNLTEGNELGTMLANIELERAKIDKRIQIQNIYYDFDKWDIRPDAAERLDHVVTLMKDNPGLTVELGSHTDSRGKDDYNMTLSSKRAAAAVAYIISEGVDSARITSKGYGESQLVNRCRNGVACSEEEHQQNRRTELRITGVSGDPLEANHWKSLEQIVQEEEIANQNKPKKSRQKTSGQKLPEANNSVPLPKPEPQGGSEIVQESRGSESFVPKAMPAGYNGYRIEITCSERALTVESDAILSQYQPIFMRGEANKKFCYFIGDFKDLAEARDFLNTTALPKFPAAQLAEFKNGKKTYIK
jgi:outer membrane protein OmpA-like peptidoglycan-associated protein